MSPRSSACESITSSVTSLSTGSNTLDRISWRSWGRCFSLSVCVCVCVCVLLCLCFWLWLCGCFWFRFCCCSWFWCRVLLLVSCVVVAAGFVVVEFTRGTRGGFGALRIEAGPIPRCRALPTPKGPNRNVPWWLWSIRKQRIRKVRIVASKFLGRFLWTWEFYPLEGRICLSQTP